MDLTFVLDAHVVKYADMEDERSVDGALD